MDDQHELSSNPAPQDEKPSVVRLLIEGRVTGVGYRRWLQEQAVKREINGWVRNRMDKSVECMFSGNEETVNQLVQMCYQGPGMAQVKRIRIFPQHDATGIPDGFIQLHTS